MSSEIVEPLELEQFLPYRLSVLANRVSRGLSRLYAEQFNLSIAQWRVMAVLGRDSGLSADAVCAYTEMDKVAVSRAVNELAGRRYVHRRRDHADRRRSILKLSAAGRRVYAKIIPLARLYESQLLSQLSADIHAGLLRALDELDHATIER